MWGGGVETRSRYNREWVQEPWSLYRHPKVLVDVFCSFNFSACLYYSESDEEIVKSDQVNRRFIIVYKIFVSMTGMHVNQSAQGDYVVTIL